MTMNIKTLTLHQPWASAILFGIKKFETRSRQTSHRGLMAIHAGKTVNGPALLAIDWNAYLTKPVSRMWRPPTNEDFPTGAILAIADLTDCLPMDADLIASISDQERSVGDWAVGRYAYKLDNVQILKNPVPARGKQGFWDWSPDNGDLDGIVF